jgi:hypothetical protein
MLAYPLSLAPMARIANRAGSARLSEVLEAFYAPLWFTHDHGPRAVARAMEWYYGLLLPSPELD